MDDKVGEMSNDCNSYLPIQQKNVAKVQKILYNVHSLENSYHNFWRFSMEYDLRNEGYVTSFLSNNNVFKENDVKNEISVLKKFLKQFETIDIVRILAEHFECEDESGEDENQPTRTELIAAVCNLYKQEKAETVYAKLAYFIDGIVSFAVDYLDDCPEEFFE